ncbi:MAG TPA: hypothetical protein VFR39_09480 [Burkholderiales bacterium]|nr:hypothetical protein [Burkholderiales bacterium]
MEIRGFNARSRCLTGLFRKVPPAQRINGLSNMRFLFGTAQKKPAYTQARFAAGADSLD